MRYVSRIEAGPGPPVRAPSMMVATERCGAHAASGKGPASARKSGPASVVSASAVGDAPTWALSRPNSASQPASSTSRSRAAHLTRNNHRMKLVDSYDGSMRVFAVVLALAACGGGSGGTGHDTPTG